MEIEYFMPTAINWSEITEDKVSGEKGFASIKKISIGNKRIRKVAYSAGYLADHWCEKGHIVFVLTGELILVHVDNSVLTITSGMSYLVGDNTLAHKVKTNGETSVFIID